MIKILEAGAANYSQDKRWDDAETILFEPDKRSFCELKEQGYEVYNTALGSKSEVKTLNLTRKPELSSFFVPNMRLLARYPQKERWDIISSVDVQVQKIDDFQLDVDFIKLDTQGSELDILIGAPNTLKNALGLEVEVSFFEIYQGQPLFGDICRYLAGFGFEFFDFTTEYRYGRQALNRRGQLSFADALFLKPPEAVTEDKIEKYMTIAKAYGKEDLAPMLKQ